MDVEELPALLEAIAARAGVSAPDAAMAMAKRYQDHLQNVTLRRYTHPPLTWTNSPPYTGTPAYVSGDLVRSIKSRLKSASGATAEAATGPYIVYGRIQEEGGNIWRRSARWLHWQNIGPDGQLTDWYKKHVYIPPRPYLAPAAKETIADGSLTRAAADSFLVSVWGGY